MMRRSGCWCRPAHDPTRTLTRGRMIKQVLTQPSQFPPSKRLADSKYGLRAGRCDDRTYRRRDLRRARCYRHLWSTRAEERRLWAAIQSWPGRYAARVPHSAGWYVEGDARRDRRGNPVIIGPAGAVHLSILDFARWADWNSGQGRHGRSLVSAETLRKLQTPVIDIPPRPDAKPGTPLPRR